MYENTPMRGRKRRRPETMDCTINVMNRQKSMACGTLLFLASFLALSVQGFTSIPILEHTTRRRSFPPQSVQLQLFTQNTDNEPFPKPFESKLPPWLTQHEVATWEDVLQQLELLERRLMHLGWEELEKESILDNIRIISRGDRSVALGCMDFIGVYLDSMSSELTSSVFLSPTVIQAAIKHYGQCVLVRKSGALERFEDDVLMKPHDFVHDEPFVEKDENIKMPESLQLHSQAKSTISSSRTSAIVLFQLPVQGRPQKNPEVEALCVAAARIKRAEILIQSFLPPTHKVFDRVQGLLLSITDDFRALTIRCVACLYRLQGMAKNDSRTLSPQTIRLAKDGLQVYSILAGRLGLSQLKKQIENAAFRILYRRQYEAVTAYYTEVGPLMHTVANFLKTETLHTLRNDEKLMALIEVLDVETRVKEPLSLWKKLIKKSRGRALVLGERSSVPSASVIMEHDSVDTQAFPPGLISSGVFDFVALRVIVRARKWSEEEDDELTREREKLLCYYIQNLLGAQWGASRVKDYIQFPKPNGYQSLHHTSGIALGEEIRIPFEVQVRSGEMHDAAEYGIASHWCYKLGSTDETTATKLLQPCSNEVAAVTFSDRTEKGTIDKSCVRGKSVPSKSYLDALHLAKKSEANVYVFMGSEDESSDYTGGLISLPGNALVRDALAVVKTKEILHEVDDKTIMRNGQKAGLNERVANGDVLWIKAV